MDYMCKSQHDPVIYIAPLKNEFTKSFTEQLTQKTATQVMSKVKRKNITD